MRTIDELAEMLDGNCSDLTVNDCDNSLYPEYKGKYIYEIDVAEDDKDITETLINESGWKIIDSNWFSGSDWDGYCFYIVESV